MNQIIIIDNHWIISMYDHLYPEPLWLHNFSTTTIPVIWVMDDAACAHSHSFSQQFTVCWCLCSLLINIGRLPYLFRSSSFSSIFIMYYKQYSKSQPSSLGQSGQLCSWTQGCMQYASDHTDRFGLRTDHSINDSCGITHLNFVSQFRH
jgi:hypothetical protein